MFYIIIGILAMAYGIWYAIDPMPVLKKKYGKDEVPQLGIRTARISGVVLALVGLGCIVINILRELGVM